MNFIERFKVNFFNEDLLKFTIIFRVIMMIVDFSTGAVDHLMTDSWLTNVSGITIGFILDVLSTHAMIAIIYAMFGYEHKVFEGLFGNGKKEA